MRFKRRLRLVVHPSPLPNIDPVWARATSTLPEGCTSKRHAACSECRDVHLWRDRLMFNGTESQCPACGAWVFTMED